MLGFSDRLAKTEPPSRNVRFPEFEYKVKIIELHRVAQQRIAQGALEMKTVIPTLQAYRLSAETLDTGKFNLKHSSTVTVF